MTFCLKSAPGEWILWDGFLNTSFRSRSKAGTSSHLEQTMLLLERHQDLQRGWQHLHNVCSKGVMGNSKKKNLTGPSVCEHKASNRQLSPLQLSLLSQEPTPPMGTLTFTSQPLAYLSLIELFRWQGNTREGQEQHLCCMCLKQNFHKKTYCFFPDGCKGPQGTFSYCRHCSFHQKQVSVCSFLPCTQDGRTQTGAESAPGTATKSKGKHHRMLGVEGTSVDPTVQPPC